MARRKGNHSVANHGNKQIAQTTFEENDDFLPEPEELAKYQALDPDFISWIKNRCDAEQLARIRFNENRMKLVQSTNRKIFITDMSTLFISAFVMLMAMSFSYFLLKYNKPVLGTVFAGASIIFYAIRVLNFRRNRKINEDK